MLLAALIAMIGVAGLALGQIRITREDLWLSPMGLFVLSSACLLPFSPYLEEAVGKGLIQLVGISVLAVVSLLMARQFRSDGLLSVSRVIVIELAIIAGIGVWQFIALNALHTSFFANFSFMNSFGPVWRDPGFIGTLHRIDSINSEPAHFCQYLGISAGLVFLRTGLFGRAFAVGLRQVVPRWAMISILAGFLLSISIVGYGLAALTCLALAFLLYRPKWGTSLKLLTLVLALVALVVHGLTVSASSDGGLLQKFQTLPLVLSSASNGIDSYSSDSLSALSLGANVAVALKNLAYSPLFGVGIGAHPASYADNVPAWTMLSKTLYGLNADDTGSLLVRLLSETGVVGAVLYMSGYFLVLLRARKAIQGGLLRIRAMQVNLPPELVVSVGVSASCLALFLTYLGRMGLYYAPSTWLLLALTAAVPAVVENACIRTETLGGLVSDGQN